MITYNDIAEHERRANELLDRICSDFYIGSNCLSIRGEPDTEVCLVESYSPSHSETYSTIINAGVLYKEAKKRKLKTIWSDKP